MYLFDGPHWRVGQAASLEDFFRAVALLVPEDAVLCLAGGLWDAALTDFIQRNCVDVTMGESLPGEFSCAPCVPVTDAVMQALALLADHRADPEIAMHLAVLRAGGSVLEWFDVPSDPMSVSATVDEPRLRAFCVKLGVACDLQAAG